MSDPIIQIGGRTVRSPWGLKFTFKKSLWSKDGDQTVRYFTSQADRDAAYHRAKRISWVKRVEVI